MRDIIVFVVITVLSSVNLFSQVTNFNDSFGGGNEETCVRMKSVEIRSDGVVVTIEKKALKALKRLIIFQSDNTFIEYGNLKLLQLSGLLVDGRVENCGPGSNWGWDKVGIGETRTYQLFFRGNMPSGVTAFSMVDEGDTYSRRRGCSFRNYKIINHRKDYTSISSEYAAKKNIDANNDGICGIYEPVGGNSANVACVKIDGEYKLIYISSPMSYIPRVIWSVGDIKANLRQTAAGVMKAEWFSATKASCTAYVALDGTQLKALVEGNEVLYLKTYPTSSTGRIGVSSSGGWTGTGFALKNGYIVTNNHVVENASSIFVLGVNGDHKTEFAATVIATDKKNDLAIIKIKDSRFKGFTNVPYAVVNRQCDVGEDVFVLGYPLTTYMGEEIKLTNGIVSSRSGYQGDITTYQISAPLQPGNSGGPMFDKKGNVVGIINAGIPGAENVGYAIKSSYLYNLVGSVTSTSIIPQANHVVGNVLSDKVKSVKNCVFYIKCVGN